MFPSLASGAPRELAVISDRGAAYLGDHAWIICLYALRNYRSWARKLTHPLLLPLARQAFAALSEHRSTISRFMGERDLAEQLSIVSAPGCSAGFENAS